MEQTLLTDREWFECLSGSSKRYASEQGYKSPSELINSFNRPVYKALRDAKSVDELRRQLRILEKDQKALHADTVRCQDSTGHSTKLETSYEKTQGLAFDEMGPEFRQEVADFLIPKT